MTDKLKPVRCGCGGEAIARSYANTFHSTEDGYDHTVYCSKCNIETKMYDTETEAITAWNRAMSGSTEKSSTVERTAKAVTRPFGDIDLHKCGNCQYYVDKSYTYCPGCGARLEWE